MLKKRLDGIFTTLPDQKAAWEARRQAMREGFMKELQGGKATPATTSLAESRKESIAKASSDEDAVIVDKGGDAVASSTGGGGGGGGGGGAKSKKKKGKK